MLRKNDEFPIANVGGLPCDFLLCSLENCLTHCASLARTGLMVNISTRNVLAEENFFEKGHGVSIGSETSGRCYNITIRNSGKYASYPPKSGLALDGSICTRATPWLAISHRPNNK